MRFRWAGYLVVGLVTTEGLAYEKARLSHEGLYLNLPYDAPMYLYMDADALQVDNATLRLSAVQERTWAEAQACQPNTTSFLEACEHKDWAMYQPAYTQSLARSLLQPDWGVIVATSPIAQLRAPTNESVLRSLAIVLDTYTLSGEKVQLRWWVGHVTQPMEARARWPIAPHEYVSRGDAPSRRPVQAWDGTEPPRLSGLMTDPFMAGSHHTYKLTNATWSRGVSIRVQTNQTTGVPIRTSVHGTIVWSGSVHRARPPFVGPDQGMNDEEIWCVMVRDAWGFVHQYLGLDADHVQVHVGDKVHVGDVVAYAPNEPISRMPASQTVPADPLKRYIEEGFEPYPFRARQLEIRVARPALSWTTYAEPEAHGWTYFHPQLAYRSSQGTSEIVPLAESTSLTVAAHGEDPPQTFHGFRGRYALPLRGLIEVFVSWQAFVETPYDPSDAMDPVSVYAMDWAVVPTRMLKTPSLCDAPDVYWRRSFEHSKLAPPTNTSLDDPSFLFAYYVPLVQVGGLLGGAGHVQWRSQFDEKVRMLIYSVTRRTLGAPDVRGGWNITREREFGRYRLAVRARGVAGPIGCMEHRVSVGDPDAWTDLRFLTIYELLTLPLWRMPLPDLFTGFLERMAHLVRLAVRMLVQ